MIRRSQVEEGKKQALLLLQKAQVLIDENELNTIDVADFGLQNYPQEGAQMITLLNTERVALKLICLLPGQTLPEHWHTAVGDDAGKEETFRVLYGTLRLYLPGNDTIQEGTMPKGKSVYYTCRKEQILRPPQQLTLSPGIKHWLQGGKEGCVVCSISSAAHCALDPFTDPNVQRITKIDETA